MDNTIIFSQPAVSLQRFPSAPPVSRLIGRCGVCAVAACATKLETTQPAAFAELYKDYSMKGLGVEEDGTIHAFGHIVFDPNTDTKGRTVAAATFFTSILNGTSPAVVDIWFQDAMTILAKHPYARELPQAFLDLMAADLNGPLAADYRGYIRHEVKPVLDRISDVLQAHYAAIEAPSVEWLMETFPGHSSRNSPDNIVDNVICYTRAWDGVLAEWDAGRLDVLFPPCHMMPYLAIAKLNTWSKERGETKQHELIGMSSGKKAASTKQLAAISAAFEIEPAIE
mgnify:CR=1 FL=1